MKCLLTGGGGFIGKNLISHLAKEESIEVLSPNRQELDLTDRLAVR
jgi:dTDP-4-dehydrorhamnose reductase